MTDYYVDRTDITAQGSGPLSETTVIKATPVTATSNEPKKLFPDMGSWEIDDPRWALFEGKADDNELGGEAKCS